MENKSQLEKFIDAARQFECDEDETHWDEALKKVVKPAPKIEISNEVEQDQGKTE